MEMKHTPGPWIPWKAHGGKYLPIVATVQGKSAQIGRAELFGQISDEECEANARLIAAAPELLELAETLPIYPIECKHDEEPWYCDCCRNDWELALQGWNKKRESVIRKAKGLHSFQTPGEKD